jgi:dUTP pyrophosphatase
MAEKAPTLKVRRVRPGAGLPQRVTPGSTGLDLFACIEEAGFIELGRDPVLVPTGIAIELPPGYDAQVRPRSGLSAKGVGVAFGTIDSDYRGEVLVTMYLFGALDSYTIRHSDRIAQLVIGRWTDLPVVEVAALSETERGPAGHGSTGV